MTRPHLIIKFTVMGQKWRIYGLFDTRLSRRTAQGRYELSESELVQAIRACQRAGDLASRDFLCEVLRERCTPEFERHSWGLRQRPDLREEAIAGMREHILREALNPKERFMCKFGNYVGGSCKSMLVSSQFARNSPSSRT